MTFFNINDELRSVKVINDGKYKIVGDKLVNIKTGKAIPSDEPIFILRAQDIHSVEALTEYSNVVCSDEVMNAVDERIKEFEKWQEEHSDLVKEPD